MKRYLNANTISILALFLLVLAKFIPFIFGGQVPIPFDIMMGGYYPWLSEKWGYAVSVPVRNPTLSDVISQFYPWLSLAKAQVTAGHLPLWNPTSLMGYPFLANFQLGLFYPTTFLIFLGKLPTMRTIQILIQQVLGFLFMFLYLRSKKISKTSSLLGSLIYNTAGRMTTDFELSLGGRAMIWLPLALLVIEKMRKTVSYWLLLPIALAEYAVITAGQFQVIIFINLITLAVLLMTFWHDKKKLAILVLGLFLGAAIASIQLIPTMELLFHSIRLDDQYIAQVGYGILPWRHLITTFIGPDVYGNPATGNYFGFWNYFETAGYIGIISTLLIYLAFLDKGNRFAKIGLIICILFAFNSPLASLPYLARLPLLRTAGASRILYPLAFFAAYLSAVGLDLLAQRKYTIRLLLPPLIILVVVLDYFVFSYLGYALSPFRSSVPVELARATTSVRNLALPALVFLAGFILIFQAGKPEVRQKNKSAVILKLVLVLILSLDLLRFHYKYNPFIDSNLAFPKTKITDYLLSHPGRFITTSSEVLPSNTWTAYQLDSIFGYENLAPSAIGGYFKSIDAGKPVLGASERYLNSVGNYQSNLLSLAGVKYIVTLKRDKIRKIDPNGDLRDDGIDLTKYVPVFTDKAVVILENQKPNGKYYLSYSPIKTKDDEETLALMLEEEAGLSIFTSTKLSQSYSDNHQSELISLEQNIAGDIWGSVTASGNGILNIAATNFPGWVAYLDNKPVRIIKSNFLFLGLEVPAGKHDLKLFYRPRSFTYGALISVSSIVILFSVIIIGERNRKNETKR